MKKTIKFIAAVLFAGSALLNGCGKATENQTVVKDGEEAVSEIVYACPMHPEVTGGGKGDSCSKCGMALVAVEGDAESDTGSDDGHDHAHE